MAVIYTVKNGGRNAETLESLGSGGSAAKVALTTKVFLHHHPLRIWDLLHGGNGSVSEATHHDHAIMI